MTSSPGWNWQRSAAMSRAWVPLVVRNARAAPVRSVSHSWHFFEKAPSPHILWEWMASRTYWSSRPQ